MKKCSGLNLIPLARENLCDINSAPASTLPQGNEILNRFSFTCWSFSR